MISDNTSLGLRDRRNPRVDLGLSEMLSSDKTCSRNFASAANRRAEQWVRDGEAAEWTGKLPSAGYATGSLAGVASEECRSCSFVGLASRHAANKRFEFILIGDDLDVIHREEDNGGYCPGSLVAVNERMVLSDVEQVRRSHLEDVLVQILITESGSGHRDGRLKQAHVSDAERATVVIDLVAVYLKDIIETKELDVVHLLGQLLQGTPVPAVGLVECFPELGGARFVPNRSDNEHVSVRRDLDWSVVVYLEQIQHTALNNQSHAVAVFCEFLYHVSAPPCCFVHTLYHQ